LQKNPAKVRKNGLRMGGRAAFLRGRIPFPDIQGKCPNNDGNQVQVGHQFMEAGRQNPENGA